ncbi:MAG: nucleoside-diphosphate kinase [Acidimicrobiaceae bacterium]
MLGMDRTLIILKPDALERGLGDEIIGRIEAIGLKIATSKEMTLDRATAELHYAEHEGKPYYAPLVDFITRGPVLVAIVEGPQDTWQAVRTLMGATDPKNAAPGTIRGDLATEMSENLIHGSDSADSAKREIGIFFPELA